ncbi:MAG: hypothetical protein KDC53_06785 [Saprospiraceae bacterium]|nr:hypothetical protein [Saprospiraceae bacterium]
MKNSISFRFLFVLLLFSSCRKEQPIDPPASPDSEEVIESIVFNVILPSYLAVKNKAIELEEAATLFRENPGNSTWVGLQKTWSAAHISWQHTEGFAFGPVQDEALRLTIDSWPIDVQMINQIILGSEDLSIEALASKPGSVKGFHAMEYLLWGLSGHKSIEDFSERELEYLSNLAILVKNDVSNLYDAWTPSAGNYAGTIVENTNTDLPDNQAVLLRIVDALKSAAGDLGDRKIGNPFLQEDTLKLESRMSANSKADFIANLESIENIYLGQYFGEEYGQGISTLVVSQNAPLNTSIKRLIEQTKSDIEFLPFDFSKAILELPYNISSIQEQVKKLEGLLAVEVRTIINNLE